MERTAHETKLARAVRREREMKRVANASEEPVVVPVVVIAIDVHVALVIVPAIEGGLYGVPSVPPPLEYS